MESLASMRFLDTLYYEVYVRYKDEHTIVRYEMNKDTPPDHMNLSVFVDKFYIQFIVDKNDFKDIPKTLNYCLSQMAILCDNIDYQEWLLDNCFVNRKLLPPEEIGEMICEHDGKHDSLVHKFITVLGDEYGYYYHFRIPTMTASYSPVFVLESWTEIGEAVHKYFERDDDSLDKYFIEKEVRKQQELKS